MLYDLQESGITNSHFHSENLLKSVNNLFSAGTETTAKTLRFGLLLMAKNPKIQGKDLKTSAAFIQKHKAPATSALPRQKLSS